MELYFSFMFRFKSEAVFTFSPKEAGLMRKGVMVLNWTHKPPPVFYVLHAAGRNTIFCGHQFVAMAYLSGKRLNDLMWHPGHVRQNKVLANQAITITAGESRLPHWTLMWDFDKALMMLPLLKAFTNSMEDNLFIMRKWSMKLLRYFMLLHVTDMCLTITRFTVHCMSTNMLLYQWPPFRFKTISLRCRSALISLSWHRECDPAKCQLSGQSQTACPDSEKQVWTSPEGSDAEPQLTQIHTTLSPVYSHCQQNLFTSAPGSKKCGAQIYLCIFPYLPEDLGSFMSNWWNLHGCKQIPRQHVAIFTYVFKG